MLNIITLQYLFILSSLLICYKISIKYLNITLQYLYILIKSFQCYTLPVYSTIFLFVNL